MKGNTLRNYSIIVHKMIIYNLRIIFANKFIWFLVGSVLFYVGLSIYYVFANDVSKMEDLYGIFLYKIWLVRILLIFIIAFLIMLVFTFLSSVLIVKFRIVSMTGQVMAPVIFLGVMAFMLSTIIRNGNGTAVVMIVFGLLFLVLSGTLSRSQWNVFLNPYSVPRDLNEVSWSIISFKNRIILITGTIVFLLAALYNLQKREKFM